MTERSAKEKEAQETTKAVESGFGISIGPFAASLSKSEEDEQSSDRSRNEVEIVMKKKAHYYEIGLNAGATGHLCVRADVGSTDSNNKVVGVMPSEQASTEDWNKVGCIHVISQDAVAASTIDQLRQLSSQVLQHMPQDTTQKILAATKPAGNDTPAALPFSSRGQDALISSITP